MDTFLSATGNYQQGLVSAAPECGVCVNSAACFDWDPQVARSLGSMQGQIASLHSAQFQIQAGRCPVH
jgi:hypothetical protein